MSEDAIIVNHLKREKNEGNSSSSKRIYSNLCNGGYVGENEIIPICNLKNLELKCNKIILVDDFIGSGETMIKALNKLEDNDVRNKKIYILCYVCHIEGEKIIKEYQTKK